MALIRLQNALKIPISIKVFSVYFFWKNQNLESKKSIWKRCASYQYQGFFSLFLLEESESWIEKINLKKVCIYLIWRCFFFPFDLLCSTISKQSFGNIQILPFIFLNWKNMHFFKFQFSNYFLYEKTQLKNFAKK